MPGIELIAGERMVGSYLANLVIRREDYGLNPFPVAGAILGEREAIGGRLHLTSKRLVFAAHLVNRLKGRLTILLPAITRVGSTRVRLRRHLAVQTANRTYLLGVWFPAEVTAAIEGARAALTAADVADLEAWLTGGRDLELNRTANAISEVARLGIAVHSGVGMLNELAAQETLSWLYRRQDGG